MKYTETVGDVTVVIKGTLEEVKELIAFIDIVEEGEEIEKVSIDDIAKSLSLKLKQMNIFEKDKGED